MNAMKLACASVLCFVTSPVFADPEMSVVLDRFQGDNWVWRVDIIPDFELVPPGAGTPVAVELGFRLSGAPLVSVTNINPTEWDFSNPGSVIFGWEVLYPGANNHPVGIEANCAGCSIINPAPSGGPAATLVSGTANEIFAAMGSVSFTTPGPKPLLEIMTAGPSTSGASFSTIEWLGAYDGNARIAQIIPDGAGNFTIIAGIAPDLATAVAMVGTVSAADYVVWRKRDGSQEGYDAWRTNFGAPSSGTSLSAATVPELTSSSLLILGVIFGNLTWHRCARERDRKGTFYVWKVVESRSGAVV
jgi:hypothetical protein